MIFCFSGTGNSEYVAKQIAVATDDKVVSINALIKQNETKKFIIKDSPIIFVCPAYAWRMPRIVDEFIRYTSFDGTNKAYFIMTCGSEAGDAIRYIKILCNEKNWDLQGFSEIIMPDNYTGVTGVSDKEIAKVLINKAIPKIRQTALDIKQGHTFFNYRDKGIYNRVASSVGNSLFYFLFVHAKGFRVTDKCTGCTKCEKICPLNNISIKNQNPTWGNTCTHCMACINRCPVDAIEYKKRTQKKERYYFEKIYK